MDKSIQEIQNMNRAELIEFLKTFSIYKKYDFKEYVDRKEIVLQKISELNIVPSDIPFSRVYSGNVVLSHEYK